SVDPQDYTATRRWTLGVQATEVGSHFRSIANDLLPSDKAMQGLFAQYLHDRWLIDSALARETNNLDDLAERSTTEIRQGHVQVNYTDYMPQDSGLHAWLGSPAHSVRVQRARGQDRTTAPGLFPTDYTTDTVTTALQFNQTHWNWGLGYTYSRFEDHADTQVDTDTRTSSVNTQFLIDPRLTLTLGGQLQTTRNRDFGTRADYRIATIGTQFILIPDRLFGQLNAQFNADRARRDPFFARDTRQDVYGGELVWRWLQPEQAAAGVDVVLSVASQSWRDHVFQQSIDGHQIFLSLRSSLPVSYNGGL
ncbi:MAG: MtrB/PioB family outer membrane beta-barrel protein, partial [Gammaproteobacteria bacterium]|nr:MtrB/PioB family outer membrane beta-barrel protein [Gammaproteobacteria bacterium]